MKAFDFVAARDARHAVALLAERTPTAKVKVLAGGTDLLADLKFAPTAHAPDVVIDISRATELKHISMTDEGLRIGALVTHTEIMHVANHPRTVSLRLSTRRTRSAPYRRAISVRSEATSSPRCLRSTAAPRSSRLMRA